MNTGEHDLYDPYTMLASLMQLAIKAKARLEPSIHAEPLEGEERHRTILTLFSRSWPDRRRAESLPR